MVGFEPTVDRAACSLAAITSGATLFISASASEDADLAVRFFISLHARFQDILPIPKLLSILLLTNRIEGRKRVGEMKTLDEMIAVMEASKTKKIQCIGILGGKLTQWIDLEPGFKHWNWADYDYRVKLETNKVETIWMFKKNDDAVLVQTQYIELTPEIREKLGIA